MDPKKYINKRAEFIRDRNKASSSKYIRKLLFDAVVSADVCILIYIEFLEAMTSAASRLPTELKKREEAFVDIRKTFERLRAQNKQDTNADDLLQLSLEFEKLQPILDKDLSDAQETVRRVISSMQTAQQSSNSAFQALENSIISQLVLLQTFTYFSQLVHSFSVEEMNSSLEKIFQGSSKDQVIEGATTFAEYVLGWIPVVGPVAATVRLFYDLYQTKIGNITTADEYVGYLEAFAASADEWSLTAQIIIDAVSDVSTFKPLPLEESEAKLREQNALEDLKARLLERKALRVQELQQESLLPD